ncbi:hypothetical protein M404DRAFT_30189 [Pisolithus tinctorius Marx 270]|uniref:Uncharacterized protein n=1 Tax=Pisolithus tinctorius Marx 270 TaxID=870435 RepID=A0A0C3NFA7_PISTI|nr:hypothetical protein M404DRAFT_30189 [Pisolithus tinctorius Marx 270]
MGSGVSGMDSSAEAFGSDVAEKLMGWLLDPFTPKQLPTLRHRHSHGNKDCFASPTRPSEHLEDDGPAQRSQTRLTGSSYGAIGDSTSQTSLVEETQSPWPLMISIGPQESGGRRGGHEQLGGAGCGATSIVRWAKSRCQYCDPKKSRAMKERANVSPKTLD